MRLLLFCVGLVFSGLGGGQSVSGEELEDAERTASGEREIATQHLDLSTFEPVVRERLERALAALADAKDDASTMPIALANQHGDVGRLLHAYEQLQPAETYYRQALAIAPDAPLWHYYLAMALEQTGRLEEAKGHLQQATGLDDDGHAVRLRLADVRMELRDEKAAAALWQDVLEEHSDCPRALAGLGQAALARGDFQEAIDFLERAVAAAPEASRLHYSLGMVYRGAGDLPQAQDHLERAGDEPPRACDPWQDELLILRQGEKTYILRAVGLLDAGEPAAAVRLLERAVAINPQSTEGWTNLAVALRRSGRRDEAEQAFRTALEIEPSNARARTGLASRLFTLGEREQAIVEVRAAVAADALYQPARFVLGRLLLASQRYEEALEQFVTARELDPGHTGAWLGETLTLFELGRHREALAVLEEAHRVNPEAALLTLVLARLLAASPEPEWRDGQRAESLARSVADPSLVVMQFETLALALAEQDRCAAALEWMNRAVEEATAQGNSDFAQQLQTGRQRLAGDPPCRPDAPTVAALLPWLLAPPPR